MPNRLIGQKRQAALPIISFSGKKPPAGQKRLSQLLALLSPKTNTCPFGIVVVICGHRLNSVLLGQKYLILNILGFELKLRLALTTVIFFEIWRYFPLAFLFILARLQAIPKDLYEAADVDGAGPFRKFFHITLPQITAILSILFMIRFIWNFNKFEDIFLLTGGASGTLTLPISVYQQGFAVSNIGMGSAVSIVIVLLLITFMIIYFKLIGKKADEI